MGELRTGRIGLEFSTSSKIGLGEFKAVKSICQILIPIFYTMLVCYRRENRKFAFRIYKIWSSLLTDTQWIVCLSRRSTLKELSICGFYNSANAWLKYCWRWQHNRIGLYRCVITISTLYYKKNCRSSNKGPPQSSLQMCLYLIKSATSVMLRSLLYSSILYSNVQKHQSGRR